MELIHIKGNTYYIKNPTNIGVYKINDNEVYIIDSGNDKDAGKKIIKLLDEHGLKIKGIINTHSHADHVGGNKLIQDRESVDIYTNKIEKSIGENPILEPSILYGGFPFKELRSKFLMAEPSKIKNIEENPIKELEHFLIRGHYFDMIGIKTPDDVYFIGDSLFSKDTIEKYHIFYLYDAKEFLNTLDYLDTLNGYFVPSHTDITDNIKGLIKLNRDNVLDTLEYIKETLKTPMSYEELLKDIFDHYNLMMNESQYFLIGSTIKSYLAYLKDENSVFYTFKDNIMIWELNKKD